MWCHTYVQGEDVSRARPVPRRARFPPRSPCSRTALDICKLLHTYKPYPYNDSTILCVWWLLRGDLVEADLPPRQVVRAGRLGAGPTEFCFNSDESFRRPQGSLGTRPLLGAGASARRFARRPRRRSARCFGWQIPCSSQHAYKTLSAQLAQRALTKKSGLQTTSAKLVPSTN